MSFATFDRLKSTNVCFARMPVVCVTNGKSANGPTLRNYTSLNTRLALSTDPSTVSFRFIPMVPSRFKYAPVLWSVTISVALSRVWIYKNSGFPLQRFSPVCFRLEFGFIGSIPTKGANFFSSGLPMVVLRLGECAKRHGSRSPFSGFPSFGSPSSVPLF